MKKATFSDLDYEDILKLSDFLLGYFKKKNPSIYLFFLPKKDIVKIVGTDGFEFKDEFWKITLAGFFKGGIDSIKEIETQAALVQKVIKDIEDYGKKN